MKYNTIEELQAELEKRGIKPGQWSHLTGGKKQTPKMKEQESILLTLRSLIQAQLDADLVSLDQAREKLNKLKHGGGER
jgi:hypothetical protein